MSSILHELLNRVQAVQRGLDSGLLVRDVVIGHESDIMELQRIQLLEGKAASGEDIRPYYSEDLKPGGWFYSTQTAANYAAWKQDIDYPYSVERNPDAPNLYINGKFHSELGVEFGPDSVGIMPTTSYAMGIVLKYGINTFGLMPQKWDIIFTERGGYWELLNEVKSILYV